MRDNKQLRLYALVLAALDSGVIRVPIALHSIRRRERHTIEITDDAESASKVLDWLEATATRAELDQELSTRVGPHCQECPIKPTCPAFVTA